MLQNSYYLTLFFPLREKEPKKFDTYDMIWMSLIIEAVLIIILMAVSHYWDTATHIQKTLLKTILLCSYFKD